MTTKALVLAMLVATGCVQDGGNPLATSPTGEQLPPAITSACELAAQRCSRCHPIDRITRARITEPDEWQRYVHKMRLMPASGIPDAEEPTIVDCLVFRVGGNAGLAKLARLRAVEGGAK